MRANNIVLGAFPIAETRTDYLESVSAVLPSFQGTSFARDFPQITMYQPNLREAYVQSYFLGVQDELTDTLTLEVAALGSLGRKLITTDVVNREFSVPIDSSRFLENPFGRYHPELPRISYRSNQGASNYNALSVMVRYRGKANQLHLAYTWSHTIDNQSEPLAGDFFDSVSSGRLEAQAECGRGVLTPISTIRIPS